MPDSPLEPGSEVLLSICVPTKDRPDLLLRNLRAVLGQIDPGDPVEVPFPPALTATFLLNRAWTFKSLRIPAAQAYGAYTVIQIAGALINLAAFALCVLLVPMLYQWPLVALAIGAGASLLFNFFASRRLVFVK